MKIHLLMMHLMVEVARCTGVLVMAMGKERAKDVPRAE